MFAREEGYDLTVHIESRAEFERFSIERNCHLDHFINDRHQVRRLSSFHSPKVMQLLSMVVSGILRLLPGSFDAVEFAQSNTGQPLIKMVL